MKQTAESYMRSYKLIVRTYTKAHQQQAVQSKRKDTKNNISLSSRRVTHNAHLVFDVTAFFLTTSKDALEL